MRERIEIMFSKRLESYREELNLSKREFAEKLGLSESYYNMVEHGKRTPSKSVMYKLVSLSGKPEQYWLYGMDDEEYIREREICAATKLAIQQIVDLKLIKDFESLFNEYTPKCAAEELLIAALKADLSYIHKK
jgi:transcriptional regulator with XRE-family HTH domain